MMCGPHRTRGLPEKSGDNDDGPDGSTSRTISGSLPDRLVRAASAVWGSARLGRVVLAGVVVLRTTRPIARRRLPRKGTHLKDDPGVRDRVANHSHRRLRPPRLRGGGQADHGGRGQAGDQPRRGDRDEQRGQPEVMPSRVSPRGMNRTLSGTKIVTGDFPLFRN
jgi:hypothetical protein